MEQRHVPPHLQDPKAVPEDDQQPVASAEVPNQFEDADEDEKMQHDTYVETHLKENLAPPTSCGKEAAPKFELGFSTGIDHSMLFDGAEDFEEWDEEEEWTEEQWEEWAAQMPDDDDGGGEDGSFATSTVRPSAEGSVSTEQVAAAKQQITKQATAAKGKGANASKERSKASEAWSAELNQKLGARLAMDSMYDPENDRNLQLSTGQQSVVNEQHKKTSEGTVRFKGKEDRATNEQVMDPRTRMILFKMINQEVMSAINGCISTGKEANVYHATSQDGDRAVKIYKTSILVFKDRERYVTGEFRFRNGYCKSNPRKMVKVWAEKEFRNLRRLRQAGIRSPEPVMLRSHVLVMKYIGKNGYPAPRLKDAGLGLEQFEESYLELVKIMRRMFQVCRLVHGDLSEYNLLFYKGHLWVIDVSQSVEHDHPQALDFLRRDCANVNDFYRKVGLTTMSTRELYQFITDVSIAEEDQDSHLQQIQQEIAGRPEGWQEDSSAEAVFMEAYIPRSMEEVPQHIYERIQEDMEDGIVNPDCMYSTQMLGIQKDTKAAKELQDDALAQGDEKEEGDEAEEGDEDEDEDEEDEEGDDAEQEESLERSNFTKEEWKAKKKELKAQTAEKRTEKVPKHVKKRYKRKASNNSKRGKT